jgi:hypothetical protein
VQRSGRTVVGELDNGCGDPAPGVRAVVIAGGRELVRLQLHNLACNLAMPQTAEPWSLTSLRELIKIGAKVVSHGRYMDA